jgi:hypothetical protein
MVLGFIILLQLVTLLAVLLTYRRTLPDGFVPVEDYAELFPSWRQ